MEINSKKDFDNLIKNNEVVLVDFWAAWCGPCRILGPIMDEIISEEHEGFVVAKVNVDDNSELAKKYGVRGLPTVIAFRDGVPGVKVAGVRAKQEYLDMVK